MGALPNTENIEDGGGFEPLPRGKYEAVITQTEQVETKNGDPMLRLTIEIIEGQYTGRKVFDQFMLQHPNEKAQLIGLQKLKSIKLAVGKPGDVEESDLWGTPIQIGLKVEEPDGYAARNVITFYKALAQPVAPAPAATVAKKPAEATKRSWR